MKNRIWELDAFRGLCVLGMIVVHFIFDLTVLYGILHWDPPVLFSFVENWGGVLFLLLSGVCATLGSRSIRRGIIVFGCGMLCTLVTACICRLGMAGADIVIRFGILHCLGLSMILWAPLKKLPTWLMAVFGAVLIILGFLFRLIRVASTWLFPLGLVSEGFSSSDYFPMLPYFGFFLTGAVLGRSLYRKKKSLLPNMDPQSPFLRFLGFCGRQSLLIYLLHQPVLNAICILLSLFDPTKKVF